MPRSSPSGPRAVPLEIRRVRADDWEQARALRLEMLLDTPIAFLETYDDALRRAEDSWRADLRRDMSGRKSARFVAVGPDGLWAGTMRCFVEQLPTAWLVAVYVTPAYRGSSHALARRLLDEVVSWARDAAGASELRLEVHEENVRARAFYRREGFRETGATTPYPLDTSALQIEMARRL